MDFARPVMVGLHMHGFSVLIKIHASTGLNMQFYFTGRALYVHAERAIAQIPTQNQKMSLGYFSSNKNCIHIIFHGLQAMGAYGYGFNFKIR